MKRRTVLLVSGGIAAATLWGKTGQTQTTRSILPGETVTLAQGLTGYYVRPTGAGPFPAVLVLMEAFGLNAYIKSVCDRLAKAGYAAKLGTLHRWIVNGWGKSPTKPVDGVDCRYSWPPSG